MKKFLIPFLAFLFVSIKPMAQGSPLSARDEELKTLLSMTVTEYTNFSSGLHMYDQKVKTAMQTTKKIKKILKDRRDYLQQQLSKEQLKKYRKYEKNNPAFVTHVAERKKKQIDMENRLKAKGIQVTKAPGQ